MFIAIGVARPAVATTPLVPPPRPHSPSGPVVGTLVPLLIGWLMISTLIARRFGVFRRQTVVGPDRIGRDETPWLPLFLFFASYALAGLIGPALLGAAHLAGDRRLFAAIHAIYLPFVVFVLFGMAKFRTRGLERIGLNVGRLIPGMAGGLVLLFTLYPVVFAVGEVTAAALHWIGRPPPSTHQVLQKIHDNGGDHSLVFLLVTVAVFSAPLFEELVFRGCLQTALSYAFAWVRPPSVGLPVVRIEEEYASGQPQAVTHSAPASPRVSTAQPGPGARWAAIVVTSLAFAAVHPDHGSFAPLFVLAVGLGLAYEMTGNLWVTITAHALFNAAQILIFRAVG